MQDERSGELETEVVGKMALPDFPSDRDWGLSLARESLRRNQ